MKRQRIDGLGKFGLGSFALVTDVARLLFSTPFLAVPVVGIFVSILVGFGIGLIATIVLFFVYTVLFKVKFTERLVPRLLCYFLGSAVPFGTTLATGITIALISLDDARYNAKQVEISNNAPPRSPRTSPTPPAPRGGGSV